MFGSAHSSCYFFGRYHQIQTYCQAVERIFYRCIIYKRNGERVLHTDIAVGDDGTVVFLLDSVDEERAPYTPSYLTSCKHRLLNTSGYQFVVTVIDNNVAIFEERQFLHAFLL